MFRIVHGTPRQKPTAEGVGAPAKGDVCFVVEEEGVGGDGGALTRRRRFRGGTFTLAESASRVLRDANSLPPTSHGHGVRRPGTYFSWNS